MEPTDVAYLARQIQNEFSEVEGIRRLAQLIEHLALLLDATVELINVPIAEHRHKLGNVTDNDTRGVVR